MATSRFTASIAAGAEVENAIAGSINEVLPLDATVSFALLGSAAGLLATIQSGSDILLEESPVPVGTTFGKIPDDVDVQDVAVAGERVKVKIRNPTAGALTYYLTMFTEPMV